MLRWGLTSHISLLKAETWLQCKRELWGFRGVDFKRSQFEVAQEGYTSSFLTKVEVLGLLPSRCIWEKFIRWQCHALLMMEVRLWCPACLTGWSGAPVIRQAMWGQSLPWFWYVEGPLRHPRGDFRWAVFRHLPLQEKFGRHVHLWIACVVVVPEGWWTQWDGLG